MITNTIKGTKKEIIKHTLVECEVEDLWVQFNYSDTNATIRHNSNKSIADLCACHFFAADGGGESPSKKKRVNGKQGEEALELSPKDSPHKKQKKDDQQKEAWQL